MIYFNIFIYPLCYTVALCKTQPIGHNQKLMYLLLLNPFKPIKTNTMKTFALLKGYVVLY